MPNYVDVYVLPVPRANVEAYRKMAATVGAVWKEHGAIDYLEIIEQDVKVGVQTSFPQAVQRKDDEVVVVGWITFASREERDRINAAVMKDPRCAGGMDMSNMPFDPKRMFWGGFTPLVEA
jgi:uncharacterized protein YbaA (DUF1428 family)